MKQNFIRGAVGALAAAVLAGGALVPAHATTVTTETESTVTSGPKNVIYMIGDGMGYGHVVLTNVFESGQSKYQAVRQADGTVAAQPGQNVQNFENYKLVSMQTTPVNGNLYDPELAWSEFDWANHGFTDSAAAGTAMATGHKTINGKLGVHPETDEHMTNISEVAHNTGRAAGVISSVQYNHATPASFAVSNISRNNYQAIGTDMIDAEYLDVVMGAGHPLFTDDGEPREFNDRHMTQADYNRLTAGETAWKYIEEKSDFEAWANGENLPQLANGEKGFGLAQVATTLQEVRSNTVDTGYPVGTVGLDPFNDNVPDLATMSKGALNILGQDEDGFFLMIEGGAIDWSGHANETARDIEETQDFFRAIEAVEEWVAANSSWDETLLLITADHETGYLWGASDQANPDFTAITGSANQTPTAGWYSDDHTNHLVPLWLHGAGSDEIVARATMQDPVRGAYLDNTDPVNTIFNLWQPVEGDVDVEATVDNPLGTVKDQPGFTPASGELVLTVTPGSKATLGNQQNAGDALQLTGTLPLVTVTDTRTTGNGWTLSGQSSDLRNGNQVLTSDHLGWTPRVQKSESGATAGAEVAGVLRGGAGLATPQVLGEAGAENRIGSSSYLADLDLTVPTTTQTGKYEGAVTVSLFPVD